MADQAIVFRPAKQPFITGTTNDRVIACRGYHKILNPG